MADPIIQEIKDKLDIVEIIGEYVPLRRAGVNFKGNCPFHSEKTPSFMVSRERNSWHCFGCGEGGDAFEFVKKHEGLGFPEVLKILADKAGVQLPERRDFVEADKEAKLRDELTSINELAAKFYHEALLRSQAGSVARDYLARRGLKAETIEQWLLGFAPNDWRILANFFKTRGINEAKAIQAGLLIKGEKGQPYDRFRFRVMFPFINQYGRVIGFTGRTLSTDEKEAKYVNSPESPIFHKSNFLFGYYFAKKAVRTSEAAVVVEGNMDCISSHQAGVTNVVASSGTALTVEQLNLLKRLTTNLIFAFDSDKAGLNATRKALEPALDLEFNLRIANLSGGKDPDELIQQDPRLWQKAVKEAPNFLDYIYELIFTNLRSNDSEGLRRAAKEYLDVVRLVRDPIAHAQEARRVSERLNVPIEPILDYLEKNQKPLVSVAKPTTPPKAQDPIKTRVELLEEKILALCLVDKELKQIVVAELQPSDFSTLEVLAKYAIKDEPQVPTGWEDRLNLLQFVGEEELARLNEDYPDKERLSREFIRMCSDFKELRLQSEMKNVTAELSEKERLGDSAAVGVLRQRYQKLAAKLSEISKKG